MDWEGNKEGEGEIWKEGEGEIQKEGEGSGMGKGMHGKGKGMSGVGMGPVGMVCKRQPKEIEHHYRKHKNIIKGCAATLSPSPKHHIQKDPHKKVVPTSPGVHIKRKRMSPKIVMSFAGELLDTNIRKEMSEEVKDFETM